MSTKTLKVKMAYADASTRIYNINIDHIADAAMSTFVANAATRARAMTTAAADTSSSVANTFVSNEGAKFTGIAELAVVISDEQVVYNGA